jgi:hypothetical protein
MNTKEDLHLDSARAMFSCAIWEGDVMAKQANEQYPDIAALKDIDLHSFTKAWVAELVDKRVDSVKPHDPVDRKAFAAVLATLDDRIERLAKEQLPSEAILPLLQVANELRPSNTGSYEGFETALRALQLTFTSSPNPWYDSIAFPVSQVQARSFLNLIPAVLRDIASDAAKAFIASRENGSDVRREAVRA